MSFKNRTNIVLSDKNYETNNYMENGKKTILVPWDFTQVAWFAAEHAINVAESSGFDVVLLHVIKKDAESSEANFKIGRDAEDIEKKFGRKPETLVREGTIFTTIGEVASEINANLVVMGTHGIKGMQKLMGSWALKVIASSTVPFVVVQEAPRKKNLEKIIFPVNYKKEEKEKIRWAIFIAKIYHSKVYIIHPSYNDSAFKKGLHSNLIFAQKYFKSEQIDYELHTTKTTNIGEESLEFAREIDADLILIMTTKDINLADYVFAAAEQHIIANNAKIPVMCVNPRPSKITGGFSATGG